MLPFLALTRIMHDDSLILSSVAVILRREGGFAPDPWPVAVPCSTSGLVHAMLVGMAICESVLASYI